MLLRLVANSVCVAQRAGHIIRDVLSKGDLRIVDKGQNDLQTAADRSSERCIVASLYKHFPKITIFGEEDLDPTDSVPEHYIEDSFSEEVMKCVPKLPEKYRNIKQEDICVWVDPLDGTAEFTKGILGHVTVLIGIAVKGEAIAGIIHEPYYNCHQMESESGDSGRTVWGIVGLGSFGHQQQQAPVGQNIIATSKFHSNQTVLQAVEACSPSSLVQVGGAGHKVVLLLDGKAHAYVFASSGSKKWDTCAPEAVLHAAGGQLTDIHGNAIQYHGNVPRRNKGGLVATAKGVDHQYYISRIPRDIKQTLPSPDSPSKL